MAENLLLMFQAIVTLAQLVALVLMYYLAVKQYRMSKSSEYLQRFLERELFDCREFIDEWVNEKGPAEKRLEWLNLPENRHEKARVIVFANFFQELSIAYRRGLGDRTYIIDVFSFLIRHYWERMNFWVAAYRNEKNRSTLYEDWEDLYNEIRRRETAKRRAG